MGLGYTGPTNVNMCTITNPIVSCQLCADPILNPSPGTGLQGDWDTQWDWVTQGQPMFLCVPLPVPLNPVSLIMCKPNPKPQPWDWATRGLGYMMGLGYTGSTHVPMCTIVSQQAHHVPVPCADPILKPKPGTGLQGDWDT